MGDIEKVVKKYLDDEEVIFVGNIVVDGIKVANDKASSALFVNEIDDTKIELLEEGGKILVVVPNRDWYVAHPAGKDWSIEGGQYVLREWKFDYTSGKLTERTITVGVEEKVLTHQTYSPSELKEKMTKLNLRVIALFTDTKTERYVPEHPVLYAFAEKVPSESGRVHHKEAELEPITTEELKSEKLEEPKEKKEKPPKKRKAAVAERSVPRTEEPAHAVGKKKKKRARRTSREAPGTYGLRLAWIDSNKKEHEMEIEHDIVIGRGRGDVLTMSNKHGKKKYTPMMVFDTNKKISRKHLEIVQKDGKWYIKDLGSTNGTALNGTYLPGWKKPSGGNRYPSQEVKLRDGDIITLANAITVQANVYLKESQELQEDEDEVFVDEEFGEVSEPEVEAEPPTEDAEVKVPEKPEPKEEKEEEEFPDIPIEEEPKKAPTAPPCLLKWVDGNLRPHEVEITDDVYIGKRKDNNVVFLKTMDEKITIPLGIIDLEDEISEKHLEIHNENGIWYIRDLGSERGTIVRGDYLPGWKRGKPSEYVELKDDDEILIGKYLITVKLQ